MILDIRKQTHRFDDRTCTPLHFYKDIFLPRHIYLFWNKWKKLIFSRIFTKLEFRKYWHCVSNYLYHKCRRRIALGSRRLLHSGLRFRKLLHCYINIFHQKSTCLDEEMLIKYQQNTFRNSDIPQKLFLPVSQWRPSYSLEHEQYGEVDVLSIIQ